MSARSSSSLLLLLSKSNRLRALAVAQIPPPPVLSSAKALRRRYSHGAASKNRARYAGALAWRGRQPDSDGKEVGPSL
jgi:hypothetical protein